RGRGVDRILHRSRSIEDQQDVGGLRRRLELEETAVRVPGVGRGAHVAAAPAGAGRDAAAGPGDLAAAGSGDAARPGPLDGAAAAFARRALDRLGAGATPDGRD